MVFVNPLKDKKKLNQIVRKNQQRPFFQPHPKISIYYGVETVDRKPVPKPRVPKLRRKPILGYKPLKPVYGAKPRLPKQTPLPKFAHLTNASYEPLRAKFGKMPEKIPEPKPLLEETPLVELRQINPFAQREPARMLNEICVQTRRGIACVPRLGAHREAEYICE